MQVHTCPSAISVASHCLNKILRSDKLRRKALASGMPASPPEELSNKAVDALWTAALDVVKDNFNAAEHLPKKVYDFLLPIAASTCQGLFSTVMMFAAAMPALSNGASVRVWNQKPIPWLCLCCTWRRLSVESHGSFKQWNLCSKLQMTLSRSSPRSKQIK